MSEYQVIEGTHIEDGVSYGKGQKVRSYRNLTESFPGKFKEVQVAAQPAPHVHESPVSSGFDQPVATAPRRGRKRHGE